MENPHKVKLTTDETYTAYFREWKQALVSSEPEGLTTSDTTPVVTATRKLDDTWTLAANSATDYAFSHWSCEEDTSFTSDRSTLDVTLTEDRHYVAHYLPWQITGISGMSAGGGSWMAKTETGNRPLIAGTGVQVDVDYDENITDVWLPHSTIELYSGDEAAVKAGTATLLAKREGQGDRDRNTAFDGGHATIIVDPWPADVTQITAVAYTDDCDKHYCTLNVQTGYGAEGLNLSYLTSPRNCRTSAANPGPYNPDIYDAAAVQNAETGAMELYVAGIGGVYQYVGSKGTTDFVRMPGMEDLNTSGDNLSLVSVALGVGGAADDLTSLVKVFHSLGGDQGGTVSYEVRWYSAKEGKWTTVNSLPKDKYPSTNGAANKVLILSSEEIWTQNAYYDGVNWTLHGLSFDTFEKVNSTTAYATATNGTVYKLNAERNGVSDSWTPVDLGGKLLGSRYDGALAVKLTSGGYAILNADGTTAATYPEITKDIFGDTWTKDGVFKPATYGESFVHTVGFGGDGKVYALIQGSGRNYVVRADESGWTLMDTVEAFDVGGTNEMEKRPTTPTYIASLGEGVSLLFGDKGSLYLHAQDYTVTFNSNGGSAVSPITGQAWSSFVMPIPTKSGTSFAGWYTDEGLTRLYTNPVIPAANLTLYAKWTETSADRWAEDREKALKQLDNALERMDKGDYSDANWQRVLVEYENGKYAIAIADPQPASEDVSVINKAVQDTIYAALNTAIDRMNAIPVLVLPPIDVVVSMDAQTIGLGYMIKPTIVHTTKYTQASVVITDMIKQNIREKYGLTLDGYATYHESEPAGTYAYMNTGTTRTDFYLAQVYWPNQTNAQIAQYILDVCGDKISETQVESDKQGKYLGEFDYYNMSGWMYSVSNIGDSKLPSFPGVGAAGWRMRDGEVMRWQFTVYGYGSDLNADNSEWGSSSITGDSGDKTALTYKIAQMREGYKDASADKTYKSGDDKLETSRIYMNVFDGVLCDPLANQAKLDAAVEDLDLVAAELANADALTAVTDKILAMGTVKLENGKLVKDGEVTAESGPKIEEARKAYEALTEEQKKLFGKAYPEYLEALETAEKAYEQIKDTEAAKKAAAEVDAMIDALPDPDDITLDDKDAIDAAMKAYDDLSEAAKGYVENHNKLVACKEAYDKLNDKPTPPTPVTPSKPTTPSKPKDDKPTTGSSFTDVPSGSWYADAVNYVSEKGLMNGTSKNSFSPNATTTRGMIVTILARVEGVNTNGTPWYAAGQKWAMDNGISDGTNMTGEVTREQLAAILYRYAKLKGYDTSKSNKLDSFKDADKVSSWAVEAMQWANAESLINGKSNSMLDPQGKATRAETAAILMRFMENIAK